MRIEELAAKIHDAFGPCTVLYECSAPAEIAAELKEADSILGWLETAYAVEDITTERELYGVEDPERHRTLVESRRQYLAGIKERLAAIGYHL